MLKRIVKTAVFISLILVVFSMPVFGEYYSFNNLDYEDGYVYKQPMFFDEVSKYRQSYSATRPYTPVEYLTSRDNVALLSNKGSDNYMYVWTGKPLYDFDTNLEGKAMLAYSSGAAIEKTRVNDGGMDAVAFRIDLDPDAVDSQNLNCLDKSFFSFEKKSGNSVYIYTTYLGKKYYLTFNGWETTPTLTLSTKNKVEFVLTEDSKQTIIFGKAVFFKSSKYDCWLCITEDGLGVTKTKTSLLAGQLVTDAFYVNTILYNKNEIVSMPDYSASEIQSLVSDGKKSSLGNPGNSAEGTFYCWTLKKSDELEWTKQKEYFEGDYICFKDFAGKKGLIGASKQNQCAKLYANYKYDITVTPTWNTNIEFDLLKTSEVFPTFNSTVVGKKTNSNSYAALENDIVFISYPGANSYGYKFEITTVTAIDSKGQEVSLSYEKIDGGRTIKFKMPKQDLKFNLEITYSNVDIPKETLYTYLNVGSGNQVSFDYKKNIDITQNTGINLSLSSDSALGQPKGIEIVEFKVNTSATNFHTGTKPEAKSEPDTDTDTSSYSYAYQWKYKTNGGEAQNLGSGSSYASYEIKNLFKEFGIKGDTKITVWCEITKSRDNTNGDHGIKYNSGEATINVKVGDIGSAYVFNIGSENGGRLSDYVGIDVLGLCVYYDSNNKLVNTDAVYVSREAFWKDATCTVSYNGGPEIDITSSKVGYSGTDDFDDRDYHEYQEPGTTVSYTIKGAFFKYLITKNGTYKFTIRNAQGTAMSTTYEYKGIVDCEPYFFDVDNTEERTEDLIFINTSPGSVYRSITKCEVKKDNGDWVKVGSENKKGNVTGDHIVSSENGLVTYQSYNGKCYIYKVTENGTYYFRLRDINGYYTSESSITYSNIVSLPDSLEIVPPTKTEYELYDELDITGMSVSAVYLNPSVKIDVTSKASISGFDGKTAGKQTITVSVLGASESFDIIVKKSSARMETPEFAEGLIDDGTEYQLLTPAAVVGGEMYYAFGQDGTTAPTDSWSKDIPKASNYGTYYVWYKLVADANHIDIAPVCAEITIAKRPTISFETNGGTPLASITVDPEAVISSLIGTTTKANAFFARWYTDKALTKAWDSSTPVTEDMTLYAKWVNDTYSVSGHVIGDDLAGAEIRLLKNDILIHSHVLSSSDVEAYSSAEYQNTSRGAFVLGNDITADSYSIEVSKGNRSASSSVTVKSDVSDCEIILLNGVNVSLDQAQGSPEVSANGLDKLAKSVKSDNSTAAAIEITLNVSAKSSSEAGTASVEIEKKSGQDSLQYLDFTITQMVGASDGSIATEGAISNTGSNIIAITVTCDTSNRNINVYRYHDGVAEKLVESSSHQDGTYEVFDGYIVIYTNKFSVYAIGTSAKQTVISEYIAKEAVTKMPFSDVAEGAYYYDPVLWAFTSGITGGKTETRFDPSGSASRAQALTFLWRAAGSPEPSSSTCSFTDVKPGSYYYKAVLWAVENKITKGYSDGSFRPHASVSRGQALTFLWRYEGSVKMANAAELNPFTDVKKGSYCFNAAVWAKENGITQGKKGSTFNPGKNCTRAQLVTFMYRDIVKASEE